MTEPSVEAAATLRPPVVTERLVELVCSPGKAEEVLGDLAEQFAHSATRDGLPAARRQYRRHAWRTILDLAFSPVRGRELTSGSFSLVNLAIVIGIGMAGAAIVVLTEGGLTVALPLPRHESDLRLQIFAIRVLAGIVLSVLARRNGLRPLSVFLLSSLVLATQLTFRWHGASPSFWTASFLSARERLVFIGVSLLFNAILGIGAVIGRILPLGRYAPSRRRTPA